MRRALMLHILKCHFPQEPPSEAHTDPLCHLDLWYNDGLSVLNTLPNAHHTFIDCDIQSTRPPWKGNATVAEHSRRIHKYPELVATVTSERVFTAICNQACYVRQQRFH